MAENIYNIIKKAGFATNQMIPEPEMFDIFYNEFVVHDRIFDMNYQPDFDLRQFWLDLNQTIIESFSQREDQSVAITALFKKYYLPLSNEFLVKILELKHKYFSYLAMEYCNGRSNKTIEYLLNNNNAEFEKEVLFQQNLKQAVTISEMEHLKKKLALFDAKAAFEIGDKEIISAFELAQKKNEHEAIKGKMLEWDKNLASVGNKSNVIPISNTTQSNQSSLEPRRKTISLTFIRYAAAACFVGVMVWIGVKFYNQPKENNIVANKSDTLKTTPVVASAPQFAKVETATIAVPLVKETGIGFAKSQKGAKLNVVIEDLTPRMQSIETYLNKGANDTTQVNYRAAAIHELDSLKRLAVSYTFDGTALRLFASLDVHQKNSIIETADKQFFLTDRNNFYFIKNTPDPLNLTKVTDPVLKEKLERLIFDMK